MDAAVKFLTFVSTFLSIILLASVALQTTKSEGLSGTIGGASQSTFKGSRYDELLAKVTRYTGVAWVISLALLAWFWNHAQIPGR